MMTKLSHMVNEEWVAHSHPPTYVREEQRSGGSRLKAGLPIGETEIVRRLIRHMKQPMYVLYVLHTPRGEGDPGRYQSPELSDEEVEKFLVRFSEYFEEDGRFDIWFHSPSSGATLVWDRHNLLFCYGILDDFEAELRKAGFVLNAPAVPDPHRHHYRQERDADATAVLTYFIWHKSALRQEDEQ